VLSVARDVFTDVAVFTRAVAVVVVAVVVVVVVIGLLGVRPVKSEINIK